MNHKQLLNHLAASELVQAMEFDIAKLTRWEMLGPVVVPHSTVQSAVITQLFRRWNCVFNAPVEEVSENYRLKARIVAAVVLHKYGFHDAECTRLSIEAIDTLNRQVVLSDYFYHHAEQAKNLIQSAPIPLNRRPKVVDDLTFWRAGDVVSYRLGDWYYVLYVHKILSGNTAPIIEFFDIRTDRAPTLSDLVGLPTKGRKFNDGIQRVEKYWVYGMRNNPDLANQFRLVQSNSTTPPSQGQLAPGIGEGVVTDVFNLQNHVEHLFASKP
jgi:hypothetical protein